MKSNRYDRMTTNRAVKLVLLAATLAVGFLAVFPTQTRAEPTDGTSNVKKRSDPTTTSDPEALAFLRQMMDFIGNGPAFDAKVRETVWTAGREVVGVGTYEQSGGGSGQFNLQITMHADGKHRLQQISDGKLAWTRTEIAGKVSLRRVDVGRLEEWVRGATEDTLISPKLKVGAWGEMLNTMSTDYAVRMDMATLKNERLRVLIGDLKPERRVEVLSDAERTDWPFLYPTRMHVAVKATPDTETGLGQWVPSRIEFWSDPIETVGSSEEKKARRHLIARIELYSLRQINPPAPERFRFDNQDAEVNFVNETDRYVEPYGVNLTQGQRRQLWR